MELLSRSFILFASTIILLSTATTAATTFHTFLPSSIHPSIRRLARTSSLLLNLRGGGEAQHKLREGGPSGSAPTSKKREGKQKQATKGKKGKNTKTNLSSKVGGGKSGDCYRRIKSEWKDAVKLGVGYDWVKQKTVTRKRSPSNHNVGSNEDDENNFYKYNHIRIGPLGKNILRWHFSVMGPSDSEYDGGVYHGMVILPKDYPLSPPRVQVLTPSGRFTPGEDICLSASAYHPEAWTPRWTVFSLVEALRLHMLTTANEIGGVNAPREKRIRLAKESRAWNCGIVNHKTMISDEKLFTMKEVTANEDDSVETLSSPTLVESGDVDIVRTEENESEERSYDEIDGARQIEISNSRLESTRTFKTSLDEAQIDQIRQSQKIDARLDESRQERGSATLVILKELFVLIFQRHLKLTLALFATWYMLKCLFINAEVFFI